MLRFLWRLLKASWTDTLSRMGTTALAVGLGLAGSVALFAGNWISGGMDAINANWSGNVLWGLAIALVGWMLVLYLSARRLFRQEWRQHIRVFRQIALNQNHVENDPERVEIWCLLQFCKSVYNVELVVTVTTLVPIGQPLMRVAYKELISSAHPGEEKRLRLGSLRVARPHMPAHHSVWGSELGGVSLLPGQVTIIPGSRNLIEISVAPQTYRDYIEFVTPPPGALSAVMYLTDEDRSPWLLSLSPSSR